MQVIQRSFLKRLCLFLHEGNTATQFKMIYGQLWQPRLLLITLVYRSTSEPSWTPGLWKWYHIGKFAYSSWVHPVYIRLFKLGLSNRHCRPRLRCADRRYLPSKYLIIFPMNDFFLIIRIWWTTGTIFAEIQSQFDRPNRLPLVDSSHLHDWFQPAPKIILDPLRADSHSNK